MSIGSALARVLASVAVFTVFAVGFSFPSYAQNSDEVRDLVQRIDRVQRELTTLQSFIYKGKTPPPPSSMGGGNPRLAASMEVRLNSLERELGTITGKMEEVNHKVDSLSKRVEKLVSDVDFRLGAMEKKMAEAPRVAAVAPMPGTGAPPPEPAPAAMPPQPGGPQVLGRLPASALQGRPQPPPATAAVQQPETPQQQYDHALRQLRAQRFSEAEREFRAFIDKHPKDELAANAHYWLGESYFVRKDYQRAAFTFAEGFQKFPDGNKAPDNLLKLGMSLGKLGKQKEACTALSRLLENYPNARPVIKNRVAQQRRSFNCS